MAYRKELAKTYDPHGIEDRLYQKFGKATRLLRGIWRSREGAGSSGRRVRRTRCPHAGRVPCRRHGGRARWATA